MSPRISLLAALVLCPLLWIACGDEEPPPPEPSTSPVIGPITIECGAADAQATPYPYTSQVIQRVSVRVTDAEQDLLPESLEGFVNGHAMPTLEDNDGDEIFEWSPPAGAAGQIPCRGQLFARVEALDLDENWAERSESVAK